MRFRLFVPAFIANAEVWRIANLSTPVPLESAEQLRKIAPAAASHDFALEVLESSRGLECIAIRLAHTGDGAVELFSAETWRKGTVPGLMIRVDGPGSLRVSELHGRWNLCAGVLRSIRAGFLESWWKIACDAVQRELPSLTESDAFLPIVNSWSDLLLLTSERHKGGCFIILPDRELRGIQLGYPTNDSSLKDAIVGLLRASLPSYPPPGREASVAHFESQSTREKNNWMWRRHVAKSTVDAIATIAGVDGCTVFDSELNLLGFGGKLPFRDPSISRLKSGGMRHRSAHAFCEENPGTCCFVVSQDGEISRYENTGAEVVETSPYWPEAGSQPQH